MKFLPNSPVSSIAKKMGVEKELQEKRFKKNIEELPANIQKILIEIKNETGDFLLSKDPKNLGDIFGHLLLTEKLNFKPTFYTVEDNLVFEDNIENIKNYELDWELNANPFYTEKLFLRNIVTKSIKKITGINTIEDTGGGTSDGRFMHPHGAEVVELGPINASIHKIDEHIKIDHLEVLKDIYRDILISYIES